MQSYMSYMIEARSGEQHQNADGMTRANKHSNFEDHESCEYYHNRNDKIRDSNSVDNHDPDTVRDVRSKAKAIKPDTASLRKSRQRIRWIWMRKPLMSMIIIFGIWSC